MPYMSERLDIRLKDGTLERWRSQAEAEGVTLAEFVRKRVEGTSSSQEVARGIAQQEEAVDAHIGSAMLFPKDFDRSCIDADLHHVGTTCASFGGNGLVKPRAL